MTGRRSGTISRSKVFLSGQGILSTVVIIRFVDFSKQAFSTQYSDDVGIVQQTLSHFMEGLNFLCAAIGVRHQIGDDADSDPY